MQALLQRLQHRISHRLLLIRPLTTVRSEVYRQAKNSVAAANIISNIDENGFVVKSEVYENGKMVYYSTVNIADSMGNGKQVSYYTSGGSFVATYKDGIFRDSAGNEMSETEFEKRLGR